MASESSTSPTLLGRLRQAPTDQHAWNEFVERYGRRIYLWCRKWGLQESDAQDVTQNVLFKLATRLRTFAYDPTQSFRCWLKTVTHHAWRDFAENATRNMDARLQATQRLCKIMEASEDLTADLSEEFDRELMEEAMARVRLRVSTKTWEAFRLLALDGHAGAEAAETLGMKVTAALMAKSRVQSMLRKEIAKLERADHDQDRSKPRPLSNRR